MRRHLLAVQRVWNLNQDAGAIAHQLIGPHCAPVVDVLQNFQCLRDDVVALLALDVGDKAEPAGIVLVPGGIQAVLCQVRNFSSGSHGGCVHLWCVHKEREVNARPPPHASKIIGVRVLLFFLI